MSTAGAPTATKKQRGNCCVAAIRTWLKVQFFTALIGAFITFFIIYPPGDLYYSPLNVKFPYASLPTWGLQELYHDPITNPVIFGAHQDRIVDWSIPPSSTWFYKLSEKFVNLLEVTLPARLVPAPVHLINILQGPSHLQVLRTITLLGVPDLLANKVLSLRDLYTAVRSKENQAKQADVLRSGLILKSGASVPNFNDLPLSKFERLMSFALSIGYFEEVGYRGSHIYVHNMQSVILRTDHPNNLNNLMFHFSNEAYLAWHNLFYSILSPEDSENIDNEVLDASYPLVLDLQAGTDTETIYRTGKGEYLGPRPVESYGENVATLARRAEQVKQLRASLTTPATKKEVASVKTAWEETFNQPLWTFFKSMPNLEHGFANAMTQIDKLATTALVDDYPWSTLTLKKDGQDVIVPVETLVDVGGALGSFLARVLTVYPTIPNGIVFDLEGPITAGKSLWNKKDPQAKYYSVAQRAHVELVAGDFFQVSNLPKPSSGATKYILRQILHDWNDRDAMRILFNLRQAAGSRRDVAVVLIEVNKGVAESSFTRHWVDFQMLVCCNAKERTPVNWETIFRATGWKVTSSQTTRSLFGIIELQPTDEDFTLPTPTATATSTQPKQPTPTPSQPTPTPSQQQQQQQQPTRPSSPTPQPKQEL